MLTLIVQVDGHAEDIREIKEALAELLERWGDVRVTSIRKAAYAAFSWVNGPETVRRAAERLRGVQIEHRPALEVIRRFNYPNVLIYADPPYLMSSRMSRQKQYRHEMTDQDHLELLETLRAHRGPVLLSGYASPLYDRVLEGWYKETAAAQDQRSRKREEVLWMNFLPGGQERLF